MCTYRYTCVQEIVCAVVYICVGMRVYAYVYVQVHLCARNRVCSHVHMCRYACVHICVRTGALVCKESCVQSCMYAGMRMYTYVNVSHIIFATIFNFIMWSQLSLAFETSHVILDSHHNCRIVAYELANSAHGLVFEGNPRPRPN